MPAQPQADSTPEPCEDKFLDGGRGLQTASLTRREIEELVQVIATEVVRQLRPLNSSAQLGTARALGRSDGRPEELCEGCPRNPAPISADTGSICLSPDVRVLAGLIDHTLLRPQATRVQIEKLCDEALQMSFATVCVNPAWVPLAAQKLRGSRVLVAAVAGFPFGATSTAAKRAEAAAAIRQGAQEIDMVMNIGAMKSGEQDRVETDIRGVVEVCHANGAALKVIIENGYLSDEEKVNACHIVTRAGADFVKTSTGFGPSGATESDVRLMRQTVGSSIGVKAAGGIRSLENALQMLRAGATRLGTSSSLAIMAEASALTN
jgi:deoxyribose-phosphate aldolase